MCVCIYRLQKNSSQNNLFRVIEFWFPRMFNLTDKKYFAYVLLLAILTKITNHILCKEV